MKANLNDVQRCIAQLCLAGSIWIGAGVAAPAQTLWLEAESQPGREAAVRQDAGASNDRYLLLTDRREAGTLEYPLSMDTGGAFQVLIRQTWPWRSVRYRIDEGPWLVLQKPAWLGRTMNPEAGRRWGWFTDGRFHDLAPGRHHLRVQREPGGEDAVGAWYAETGFDCFAVTADGFAPVGTIKPGEAVPEALEKDRTRSARKLGFWSTARSLAEQYEAGSIEKDGYTLPYRLLEPANPEPGQTYPLVIGLPSSGGRGDDNIAQLGACEPAKVLAAPDMREQYPCYVLAPQAPDWFSDAPRPRVTERGRPDLTLLFELISKLETEHAIDSDRIYLTGQSLGGFGVCHAMARDADRFAAAVMVAGSMPQMGHHFASTPAWLFVGQFDRRKGQLEATLQSIEAAGGKARLTVLPRGGHAIWDRAYATEGLWDWLFAQSL